MWRKRPAVNLTLKSDLDTPGKGQAHNADALGAFRYLGEWYSTTEPHDSFSTQQKNAVKNCWIVAGVYGALAIVSTLGSCYYSAKAKRS